MVKIIKNGRVYSPDDLGQKDILIANDTILSVEDQVSTDLFLFRLKSMMPPAR